MKPKPIDARVYELYDDYCHGGMERREFLSRAAAIMIVGGGSGLAMAQAMLPRYAEAQTISFTDKRIKARYVNYNSPGGSSGDWQTHCPPTFSQKSGGPRCSHASTRPVAVATSRYFGCEVKPDSR